ncbi:MAG: helix-turn-helix domain-containing protein [Bacteroides sp.]|nr:helix-turn-helix domain-containing protein [Bacteroides sp.]
MTVVKILSEVKNLKEVAYTSFEELPLFLNAETIAKLLGISVSSSYELMHEKDFPAIRIGSRLVVPKEKLQLWIDSKTRK